MQIFVLIILNLFFSLTIQAAEKKTIAIYAPQAKSRVKQWDPDSVNSGIPGSQEAIIYIAEKLVELNYKVTVFNDPPTNSKYSKKTANPRYVNANFNDGTLYDNAVIWRSVAAGKNWKNRAHRLYLWPHDLCQSKINKESIDVFTDILWLSEWQRKQWLAINPGLAPFKQIYGNGINPNQFKPITKRTNPYSCIYGSNYGRGLDILFDIWPKVRHRYPKATLDVYYGWKNWGTLSSNQVKRMKKQLKELQSLGVREHGCVSHAELNRAYAKASFWTYPCTALETFCITALKAQLNGATPVIIEDSALSETVKHGYKCKKKEEYLALLMKAMSEAEKIDLIQRKKYGKFVLNRFTWKKIAIHWKKTFEAQAPQSTHKKPLPFIGKLN